MPTGLRKPPAPRVLFDALWYRKGNHIVKGRDGHWRWSSRSPIPKWARAGRIAAPFAAALRLHDSGKLPPPLEKTWHDKLEDKQYETTH